MAPSSDRGFVAFYREYVRTALHTATTVGLTALGLLTFVHWGFAIGAIAVYVLPPLYLYLSDTEADSSSDATTSKAAAHAPGDDQTGESGGDTDSDGRDTDSDSDGGDTDSDADDGDTDSDSDGRDTDSDSDGRDADSDSDGGDTDSDSDGDDGDTDSDSDGDAAGPDWQAAVVPSDATFRDVTATQSGLYAVGDGGVVVARTDDGWERLLDDGPAADGASLTGVAATDDGHAVWAAGDGGSLGRSDTEGGRFTDHSAPADRTDNLTSVAVTGEVGDETVLLANGSGEVLRGRFDGHQAGWADPVKPGSGSSVSGLAFADGVGYCCDTSGSVFVTRDEGASWSRLGVEDAGCAFTALAPLDGDRLVVGASDGRLFEYDGAVWTPRRVVEGALAGIALLPDGDGVACGPDGTLAERVDGTWERRLVATDADLHAVVAEAESAVAVGADGTVLERPSR